MDRREFIETLIAAVAVVTTRVHGSFASESQEQQKPKKPAIPRRVLGKTGVEVSVLILGGVVAMKEAPTAKFHPAELANAAIDAGINYFDTAPSYNNGQSER
ncbi:MAG: aldo/keto reductase, partial [Phycisphaerae bacterium]